MARVEAPKPDVGTPQAWPLSIEAYHTLGELGLVPSRTELLYGQIFHKMSKSPFHRLLSQRLLRLLQRADIPGCFVWQEQPILCKDSEPEPDLAVLRGDEDSYRVSHPTTAELVIEVCVTSHDYDRSKLRAYATAGVTEVWFILGPEMQIEVHRRPLGDQFADRITYGPGGRVKCTVLPTFSVDLDSIFRP
jgi:Uma2 family endonuclease